MPASAGTASRSFCPFFRLISVTPPAVRVTAIGIIEDEIVIALPPLETSVISKGFVSYSTDAIGEEAEYAPVSLLRLPCVWYADAAMRTPLPFSKIKTKYSLSL